MNANDEDNSDEENILDRCGASGGLVRKVRSFQTETELLTYLIEEKPSDIKCSSCLDYKELEDYMSGLCLKLKIHGYEDRGDRLQYLFNILSQKFAKKEESFKIIVQLLMDMSERPTAVTNLWVNSALYSAEPDEDAADDDSERQKALLKEILFEDGTAHLDELAMQYSSGSELSEWTSEDDEESVDEKSNNDVPQVCKVRYSSSFGEFSDLTEKPDVKKAQEEIKSFWMLERQKSAAYLRNDVRKFDTHPLASQPVISSLLVLQARFGEFWEWKKSSMKQKADLCVAFEEDVVREILWQFIISSPSSSPVFIENWSVNPALTVPTLSRSSFEVFIKKYGILLSKLQNLRTFVATVERSSIDITRCEAKENYISPSPSKIYRNYAAGLQEISTYIIAQVGKIELELKRKYRETSDPSEPACTTLVQLEQKTRSLLDIINLLHEVHTKSVTTTETDEPWLLSIKLISCLETHLSLQTEPNLYGVLLFLFSKCLYALLGEILSSLNTLKWEEDYSLFVRNPLVHLNDSDFWSKCIKLRKYKEPLQASGIAPLTCLEKLLPHALNILKTCEVLNQLEEDFTRILNKSNLIVGDVVHEFLEQRLSQSTKLDSNNIHQRLEDSIDFFKHFQYIGLGNSFAADAFQFLYSDSFTEKYSKRTHYSFDDFINLSTIPFGAHEILDDVLSKWFNPFRDSAKENIQKIFQDYKVIESMTIFQEIILTVREDFAKAVIELVSNHRRSEKYKYEDSLNRNPKYQKLLDECYPEGRENFTIDLKVDPCNESNWTFLVTPHFPLNLIVTPKSVAGYLYIGRQIHRIRKSLWEVSSLSMKDSRPSEGVNVTRLLLFRFCLINFCTSIRSFFTLKLFAKDFSEFAKSATYDNDLDSIRRIHSDYLESIKTKMLNNPLIENIIIRQIVLMSELLRKRWTLGMPQSSMLMLEDTLKKCWQVVNDFESTKYSFDFNELSYHFGPPPSCLL